MTRFACAHAQSAGIALPPLLRRAGLTSRDIEDASIPLKVPDQIKCLNLIADVLNDRLLGFHVVQNIDLRRLGFLYYVAASSETLGDALQRAARYSAIVNEGVRLETKVGKTLRINFEYAGVPRHSDRYQIEAWITAIVRTSRELTGRGLRPVSVLLTHQRIPESQELDGFLGRKVDYGAGMDEVSFAGEAAKLPIVSADPYLNQMLIKCCEQAIAGRKARPDVLRASVENEIALLLPHGQARVDPVAQKLGTSARSLRRKLAAEGVTFERLREDLRFALAKRYLAERDLPISRIAWLLGYREVSAFSHAFRRWTGRTPRADRSRRRRPGSAVSSARRSRQQRAPRSACVGTQEQIFVPGSQVLMDRLA